MKTKQCPSNTILNPATNKCVKKDGNVGKKLLKQQILHSDEASKKEIEDQQLLKNKKR